MSRRSHKLMFNTRLIEKAYMKNLRRKIILSIKKIKKIQLDF